MAGYTKEGHRARHRERYFKSGFKGFTERDKLELLLFYSLPRIDTKQIAHDLLECFGSIRGIFEASFEELTKIKGVGDNTAVLIKLMPEIISDYLNYEKKSEPLDTTEKVCRFFSTKFTSDSNEKIMVACLDDKLNLINYSTIAEGVPGNVYLDLQKLVKYTYSQNSENIILAHNHPNGDACPSNEDIKHTIEVYEKILPVGIHLLDHVIVSGNKVNSLRNMGAFGIFR